MREGRRFTAVWAASALAAVALAGLAYPWAVRASETAPPSAIGEWAFQLEVKVGEASEHNVGMFTLDPDGTCVLHMRSNLAGAPHDHTATGCSWSGRRPTGERAGLDGSITVTGVATGPAVLSFVLAQRGEQMLLLLDDTSPGIVGTGTAYRR